jgi:hypothetical protein
MEIVTRGAQTQLILRRILRRLKTHISINFNRLGNYSSKSGQFLANSKAHLADVPVEVDPLARSKTCTTPCYQIAA